jgi:hypothetical protein
MTLEEFKLESKRCSLILADICALEDNQDDVKGLFLKLFDMYLKKEQGWRHTDEFKEVIKNL